MHGAGAVSLIVTLAVGAPLRPAAPVVWPTPVARHGARRAPHPEAAFRPGI